MLNWRIGYLNFVKITKQILFMPTLSQLVRKSRKSKLTKKDTPALQGCPQRRGVCVRVYINT